MTIEEFQGLIEKIYYHRDAARGTGLTFTWFVEEVGELARGILKNDRANLEEEFADVFAWLATLASMHGIRLEDMVVRKYGRGCPRCLEMPCQCPEQPLPPAPTLSPP